MGSNASHAVLSGFDADDEVLHLAELEDAELEAHWHALSTPAIGLASRPQAPLAATPATRGAPSRARRASPWRGLKRFWMLLLLTAATGAALLQVLGPPGPTVDLPLQARANPGPPSAARAPESTVATAPASAERPAIPEAPRADKPPEAAALQPVPSARVTEDRTQPAVPGNPGSNPVGSPGGNPVGSLVGNPVSNPVSKAVGSPADKRPAEPVAPPPAREAKPRASEPPARAIPAQPPAPQPAPHPAPHPATDSATRDINAAIAAITAPKPQAEASKSPPNPDNAVGGDLSVHYLAGSDAEARRLAAQLGSVFERRAIHTEAEVPRVAVIRFFQPSDHASARTVGKTLGDMGYTWRLENQSNAATGSPGTIEVWLPSK